MKKAIIALLSVLIIMACNNTPQPKRQTIRKPKINFADSLQNINKILVKKDRERITAYIKRMNLDMQESSTGLWYKILPSSNNTPKIHNNDQVEIKHQIELLDGTIIYPNTKSKIMIVGKTDNEAGLQEALKMMTLQDSAIIITPPYLAKGLLGDFNKIPARSTLIYKVKVIDVVKF